MSTNAFFGYIKQTKSGKYRGVIASLHDTGESDGDRLLHTEFESELIEDLDEVKEQLFDNCITNDIPYSDEPIKVTMMGVWESQFK